MRNLLSLFLLLIFSSNYGQQMPYCEDPNPYTIVTDCGTEFDLCVDRYTMDADDRCLELNIYSNDMGLINPCDCYICESCKHGTLHMMPNCNPVYVPDPDFAGFDTFYYMLVVYDTCVTEEGYCGPGDGKIWAIQSQYTGQSSATLRVHSKKASSWDFFAEIDLVPGQIFWIDGSELPVSQTEWDYRFYSNSQASTPYETVVVHTSCSQKVLGKDFGNFRTISGCIAPQWDKENCNVTTGVRDDISTRNAYTITTRFEDETMVIIEVLNVLPIDLVDFQVFSSEYGNNISWEIANDSKDEYLVIEKSYDGIAFFGIASYDPMASGKHFFTDADVAGESYYRLAFHSYEGNVRYSDLRYVASQIENLEVRIYPNPTSDLLHIESMDEDAQIERYEIFDMSGKNIFTHNLTSANNSILPIENKFHEGIYIVNVTLTNGKLISKRVLFVNM